MSYGYMQGTSMSSPLVAGVVATWLQAYPDLTPEQLVEVIKTTSRADSFTGDLSSGSNDWGWGKIDALAGIRECIKFSGIESIGSDSNLSPAITLSRENLSVIFDHAAPRATIEVFNTTGAKAISIAATDITAGDQVTIPLSSLPAGVYIAKVTTPSVSSSLKIMR